MTHTDGTPRIADIERQQAFERHAVKLGVDRYRRANAEATLGDTPVGVEASRDMMNSLVPAVEEARKYAVSKITTGGSGRQPQWWWLIGFLPADVLAFVACRVVLTAYNSREDEGKAVTACALQIGTAVREEVEMRRWAAREAELSENDPDHIDMYKLLTTKSKVVDSRALARWRRKIDTIEREDWSRAARLDIGQKLLSLLVEHGGGWFEKRMVRSRGKTTGKIFISTEAKRAITDIDARLELNRPYLLPMKCRPKPWRKV